MSNVDAIKKIGFTEYEAKTYLALLKEAPMSGYAIAKASGVPRSRIYEVLDSMVSKGDVIVSPGDPTLYSPLAPDELIERRKKISNLELENALTVFNEQKGKTNKKEDIWSIVGQDAIIAKVNECIRNAKKRILIELWAEDYSYLEEELRKASDRGVSIIVVGYGEIDAPYAFVYPHDISDEITYEYGGRWVVFSVDDSEVVAGVISQGKDSKAAWTGHGGLVMPITEVIIHDLYLAELLLTHREILEEEYGQGLHKLRQKFLLHPDGAKHYIT